MPDKSKSLIKVSHVFVLSHSRHIIPYVGFIRNELINDKLEHEILIYTNEGRHIFDGLAGIDLCLTNQREKVVNTICSANAKHRVILHGIYDNVLLLILLFKAKTLRYVIWSMWGADVYYDLPKGIKGIIIDKARKWVLPKIGTKIGLKGDFIHLQKNTQQNCNNYVEIGFPAWFYNIKQRPAALIKPKETNKLSAMVGNSGDAKNNFPEVIDLLAQSSLFSSLTFVLNYGASETQTSTIKAYAIQKLPNIDLVFLTESYQYVDFIGLMSCHDALIYNHDRQQGVGSLNIACEYGLDLFIPAHNPLYSTFSEWGIRLHDTHTLPSLNVNDLNSCTQASHNQASIRDIFHPAVCAQKLNKLILGE